MAVPRDEDKPTIGQIVKALGMPIPGYTIFAQYYIGNHRLAFASEKFRNAFGRLFALFADNVCPSIIDVVADRLNVTGFQCAEDPDLLDKGIDKVDDELADWAWKNIWEYNRMTRKAGEVHQEALRAGDSYVLVWPNEEGRPIIHPQQANLCTLHVNQEDPTQKVWGAKGWVEAETQMGRINLYLPDRIEKYVTINKVTSLTGGATLPVRDNAWKPFDVKGETWPLENQWGEIPMFHFSNNSMVGEMGKSELKDIIPLQDALNKCILDMMVAMEFCALPQRWIAGMDIEVDTTTGLPRLPFQPGVDRIWTVNDTEVKFGQFDQARLNEFLQVADHFRMEMARISGIPLHYFNMSGNPPSGEALRALEARLIKKAKDRQQSFGDTWEDVINFCLKIMNKTGNIVLTWEDPAPVSELDHTQALLNKKLIGISEKQALIELNYSEQQIEQMQEDRLKEQQNLGGALLQHFDRGDQTANANAPGGLPAGGPGNLGGDNPVGQGEAPYGFSGSQENMR